MQLPSMCSEDLENFEDEEKKTYSIDPTCLIVRNIPYPHVDQKYLYHLFSQVGEVVRCNIITKNPSGDLYHAFINFKTREEAREAAQRFNDLNLGFSSKLIVKLALPRIHDGSNTGTQCILPKNSKSCRVCGNDCNSRCMRCKWAYYCSVMCQRKDFFLHQRECVPFQQGHLNPQGDLPYFRHRRHMSYEQIKIPYLCDYNIPSTFSRKIFLFHPYDFRIVRITTKLHFYARIESADTEDNFEVFEQTIQTVPTSISIQNFELQKIYCVIVDKKKCRAVVMDIISTKIARLYLIDYGEKVYANITDVFSIEDECITSTPSFIICCSLLSAIGFDDPNARKNVGDILSDYAAVMCTDGLHIIDSAADTTQRHHLKLGEIYELSAQSIESWDKIYLRSNDFPSRSLYSSFLTCYADFLNTEPSTDPYFCGEWVVFKCHDHKWRRGQIISKIDSKYEVAVLDSFGSFVIEEESLRKMPHFHKYFPALIIKCSLQPDIDQYQKEGLVHFSRTHRAGFSVLFRVISVRLDGLHIIEVLNLGLNDGFFNRDCKMFFKLNAVSYLVEEVPLGADLNVSVSYFKSYNEFYVHIIRDDYVNQLERLVRLIDDFTSDLCNVRYLDHAKIGQPVLALNGKTGWFRGQVIDIFPNNMYLVVYVDFGISQQVPLENLAQMHPKFMQDRIFAYRCCIDESALNIDTEIIEAFQDPQEVFKVLFSSISSDGAYKLKLT